MLSVQHLIDSQGLPPREVCLDWAWQLLDFAERSRQDTIDNCSTVDWSHIQVSSTGELQFASTHIQHIPTVQSICKLISQLHHWSGDDVDATQEQGFEAASLDTWRSLIARAIYRQKATASLQFNASDYKKGGNALAGTASAASRIQSSAPIENFLTGRPNVENGSDKGNCVERDSDSSDIVNNSPDVVADANNCIQSQDISVDCNRDSSHTAFVTPRSRPQERKLRKPRHSNTRRLLERPRVYWWIAASLGLLALGTKGWIILQTSENVTTPLADASRVGASNQARDNQHLPTPSVESAGIDSLTASATAVDNSSNPPSQTTLSTLESTAQPDDNKLSLTANSSTSAAQTLAIKSPGPIGTSKPPETATATTDDTGNSPQTSADEPLASSSKQQAKMEGADQRGQDAATIIASASATTPKITNLDSDSDTQQQTKLPPQNLDVGFMLQAQEFPKLRVREPRWSLRIESTDAFRVEPERAQALVEKQTVRWILTPSDPQKAEDQQPTQVIVLAQLSGRRADIKWKIVAACADMPQIVVPLNQDKLDMMFNLLQEYQFRLNGGIELIRNQLSAGKLSRDQRSDLGDQRRAMENEVKTVQRARQIIADASLYVGRLDRMLIMHGKLEDTAAGQNLFLMQLGDPDKPADSSSSEPAEEKPQKRE